MVAMNVERINETLRPKSHYVKGVTPSNVIAVALMTESEQAIAVTLHRRKRKTGWRRKRKQAA
jgi:hypothetical protein